MEVGCLEERRATALGRIALCQRIALKRPEIHKYHTDMYMRSVLFMSIKHAKTHLDVIFISAVTSSAFHSTDGPCLSSDNINRTARLPVHTHAHKSKSDHYVESICVSEEDEMCAAHCKPFNQHKRSWHLFLL